MFRALLDRQKNMPVTFTVRMPKRLCKLVELPDFDVSISKMYFSIASTTDRAEVVNQCMKSFRLVPFTISQQQLDQWSNGPNFKPHLLDFDSGINNNARCAILEALRHISVNSNHYLIQNVNDLLKHRQGSRL